MLIRHLTNSEIDFEKWDACISASQYPMVYAKSWYLQVQTSDWQALVLDDYKAVFPFVIKRKYGIPFVSNPAFSQQLGLFSTIEIDEKLARAFLQKLPAFYCKYFLRLNANNKLLAKGSRWEEKRNQVLPLKPTYDELFSAFISGRRTKVRKAIKKGLTISFLSEGVSKWQAFYKKHQLEQIGLETWKFELMTRLFNEAEKRGQLLVAQASLGKEDVAYAVYLLDDKRLFQVSLVANSEGKKTEAATLIINEVIRKYADSDWVLDFEGSSIPSIGKFFESFGAVDEPYFEFNQSGFPLLKKSLLKP